MSLHQSKKICFWRILGSALECQDLNDFLFDTLIFEIWLQVSLSSCPGREAEGSHRYVLYSQHINVKGNEQW